MNKDINRKNDLLEQLENAIHSMFEMRRKVLQKDAFDRLIPFHTKSKDLRMVIKELV
jgi:hypothetical protein